MWGFHDGDLHWDPDYPVAEIDRVQYFHGLSRSQEEEEQGPGHSPAAPLPGIEASLQLKRKREREVDNPPQAMDVAWREEAIEEGEGGGGPDLEDWAPSQFDDPKVDRRPVAPPIPLPAPPPAPNVLPAVAGENASSGRETLLQMFRRLKAGPPQGASTAATTRSPAAVINPGDLREPNAAPLSALLTVPKNPQGASTFDYYFVDPKYRGRTGPTQPKANAQDEIESSSDGDSPEKGNPPPSKVRSTQEPNHQSRTGMDHDGVKAGVPQRLKVHHDDPFDTVFSRFSAGGNPNSTLASEPKRLSPSRGSGGAVQSTQHQPSQKKPRGSQAKSSIEQLLHTELPLLDGGRAKMSSDSAANKDRPSGGGCGEASRGSAKSSTSTVSLAEFLLREERHSDEARGSAHSNGGKVGPPPQRELGARESAMMMVGDDEQSFVAPDSLFHDPVPTPQRGSGYGLEELLDSKVPDIGPEQFFNGGKAPAGRLSTRGKFAAQSGQGYGRYIQEFLSLVNHQRERWMKREEEALARDRQPAAGSKNNNKPGPLEMEIHSIQVKPSGCVVLSGTLMHPLHVGKDQIPYGWSSHRLSNFHHGQPPALSFDKGDQLAVFISAQTSALMNMDSSTVLGRCIRLSRDHSLVLPNISPEGPAISGSVAPQRRGQWIKASFVSGPSVAFVDDLAQPLQPAGGKPSPFIGGGGGLEGFRYPMLPNRSPQRSTSPQHRGQEDDGTLFPPSQQVPQRIGVKPQGEAGKAFDYVVGPGPAWFVPYTVIESMMHELELEPE
jgi:hypothetical protein